MRNLKRHEKTSQDCVGFRHPYLFSFGLFQHLPGNLQVDLSVKPPLPSSARIAPELQTPLAMHPVPGQLRPVGPVLDLRLEVELLRLPRPSKRRHFVKRNLQGLSGS